jgi:hypothetical protein
LLLILSLLGLEIVVGCGDDGAMGGDSAVVDAVGDAVADATPPGPPSLAFESVEPPAEAPLGFWGFMAVPIDASRTLVFGGATFTSMGGGGSVLEETYLYDASSGDLVVTLLAPDENPGPRYCGCAAWDPVREVLVFIGGRDRAGAEYAPETWELDLAGPTWTEVAVAETPAGVVGCAMARAAGRMYVFGGGFGDSTFSDEMHRYDPSVPAWVPIEGARPGARYDAMMFPLTDDGPLLMYAGSLGPEGAAFFNDIWLFDPDSETWTEEVPTGDLGPVRRSPWVPMIDRDGFVAGYGNRGLAPEDAHGDLAYYDFASHTWTDITPDTAPSPRSFTQPVAGGPSAVAFMIGGYDNVEPMREVWRLVSR